jgi:hypothetical protein
MLKKLFRALMWVGLGVARAYAKSGGSFTPDIV